MSYTSEVICVTFVDDGCYRPFRYDGPSECCAHPFHFHCASRCALVDLRGGPPPSSLSLPPPCLFPFPPPSARLLPLTPLFSPSPAPSHVVGRYYGEQDLHELVENAAVALCAVDPVGTVVAFLALAVDAPPPVNVSSRRLPAAEQTWRTRWVLQEAEALGFRPESTLWLRVFAAAPGFEGEGGGGGGGGRGSQGPRHLHPRRRERSGGTEGRRVGWPSFVQGT